MSNQFLYVVHFGKWSQYFSDVHLLLVYVELVFVDSLFIRQRVSSTCGKFRRKTRKSLVLRPSSACVLFPVHTVVLIVDSCVVNWHSCAGGS